MDSRFVRRIVFCFPFVFSMVTFCGPDRVNCLAGEWHDAVGLPAIYTMDRDGANVRLLAKLPQMKWHGSPAWSPDGSTIVFSSDRTEPAPPPNHLAPKPSIDDVLEWKLELKGEKIEILPQK